MGFGELACIASDNLIRSFGFSANGEA